MTAAVVEPHEAVAGVAGRKDQGVDHPAPAGGGIGDQAHAPEVHLELRARLTVVDPDRRLGSAEAATLGGEAVEGPVSDDDALAGQQVLDLDQLQPLVDPRLDLGLMGNEGLPPSAVAGRPCGADPLTHHADRRVGQLLLAAVRCEPGLDGGLHVAADRLAVDATQAIDAPIALTPQPEPQHLFDFEHRYLPVGHGHPSPG